MTGNYLCADEFNRFIKFCLEEQGRERRYWTRRQWLNAWDDYKRSQTARLRRTFQNLVAGGAGGPAELFW